MLLNTIWTHPPLSSAEVKALPLLPLWVFVAYDRVNFTFYDMNAVTITWEL